MTTIKAQLLIAFSLVTGACAVDADLASTEHHVVGQKILLPDSGTGQNREVMSTFDPLVVSLYDTYGNPLANTQITFTAPASGPSSTFRFGGHAKTDSEGHAELRPYANQWAGTYTVWASADGAEPMPFVLTNGAASPAMLVPILGTNQLRTIGQAFELPLTVEVRDNYGNVVEGAPVEFVAPASGATTHMMNSAAITDDEGRASTFAVAGNMPGTYTVLAKVTGAPSIPFVLSNTEMPTGNPRATDLADMATHELTP
ncbi:MAG: Ig-like domain-containing protein [Myxococcota bacterium]|nr:Ig-like domain-containing protein [Myxococcota bacterium]